MILYIDTNFNVKWKDSFTYDLQTIKQVFHKDIVLTFIQYWEYGKVTLNVNYELIVYL